MSNPDVYARIIAAIGVVSETTDPSVLPPAIRELSRGLDELSSDDVARHTALFVRASAAMRLYDMTDDLSDLDAGIVWAKEFFENFTDDLDHFNIPDHFMMAANLGRAYELRFRRTTSTDDRDSMIALHEKLLTWPGLPAERRVTTLTQLEHGYIHRYTHGGTIEDLDTAIDYGEEALSACGPADPARAAMLGLVAATYGRRFDHVGDLDDLDVVIKRLEQAVAVTPEGDPLRAQLLTNLGQGYLSLFLRTERRDVLQACIDRVEEALACLPNGHPENSIPRSTLAAALTERYGLTNNVADLDRSIALNERNLAAGPTGHALGAVLSQLANAYADRSLRTGSVPDLDTSVDLYQQALSQFEQGSADHNGCLINLAMAHRARYEVVGATADLDAALALGKQALAEFNDRHPHRTHRQLHLGKLYKTRFDRHLELADLNTAIDLCEQSLAGVVARPGDRVQAMHSLSGFYRERFPHSRDPRDLERSVEMAERAVSTTPADDPQWPVYKSALASAYLTRYYYKVGGDADLDAAVAHIEQAFAAIQPDEQRYVRMLQHVAETYRIWSEHRPLPDGVVPRLVEAADTTVAATPRDRMRAYACIGFVAFLTGQLDRAAAMLRRAVKMVPQCAPHDLDWSDQEFQVAHSRGLIADAVAVHLAVDNITGAVELAELGRGIVLSNQLDTRSDITAPRDADADPHLADGIADIHALPQITDLQKAAGDGTVVLVNASEIGSDAVLLRQDAVIRIPLADLALADVQAHASALSGVRIAENTAVQTDKQRATPELLAWLWRTIVAPVLTELGHIQSRDEHEPLPRLWWVPTGALGLMPLHAAGLPDGPSALDYAISSYAPTIRALLHNKRRRPTEEHHQLTVAMRYTPGRADLPGCEAETRSMQARYPETIGLANEDATIDAVLSALPDATFAHFSCHGTNHPIWPSQSALHLHDGDLPVPEISRLRPRGGELAYLSACSTAQSSITQADEALHLASAFQLAGYRHVIASLWPLHDGIAAQAAHQFYSLLGDPPMADLAPVALHRVTQDLRVAYPHAPHKWAALVHSGP